MLTRATNFAKVTRFLIRLYANLIDFWIGAFTKMVSKHFFANTTYFLEEGHSCELQLQRRRHNKYALEIVFPISSSALNDKA